MALSRTAATAIPEIAVLVERAADAVRQLLEALPVPPRSGTGDAHAVAEALASVEGVGRLVDAARVRAATPLAADPLTVERLGFASPVAAVATIARVSERTARERVTLARAISPDVSICGAPLSAAHPAVAAAVQTGRVGVDAAVLITRELDAVAPRTSRDALAAAETMMVNLAAGLDATGQQQLPPVSVTYLTAEIRQIGATIDPDGCLPREQRAERRRAFRIGAPDHDGLCPASGLLLPEIAATFLGLVEATRRSPPTREDRQRRWGPAHRSWAEH